MICWLIFALLGPHSSLGRCRQVERRPIPKRLLKSPGRHGRTLPVTPRTNSPGLILAPSIKKSRPHLADDGLHERLGTPTSRALCFRARAGPIWYAVIPTLQRARTVDSRKRGAAMNRTTSEAPGPSTVVNGQYWAWRTAGCPKTVKGPLQLSPNPFDHHLHTAGTAGFHELFEQRLRAGDWDGVLRMYSSEERIGGLLRLWPLIPTDASGEVLLNNWSLCDLPVRYGMARVLALFREVAYIGHGPKQVEPVRLYRGFSASQYRRGLSWTPQLETARLFAGGGRYDDGYGFVGTVVAPPEAVLAFIKNRNESEYILDPARYPRVREVEVVYPPDDPRRDKGGDA